MLIKFIFESESPDNFVIYYGLHQPHPCKENLAYFGYLMNGVALLVQPVFSPIYLALYPKYSDYQTVTLDDLVERLKEYYANYGHDVSVFVKELDGWTRCL